MKKLVRFIVAATIFCMTLTVFAQATQINIENFDDNTITVTSTPSNAWKKNTSYYKSAPNAYRGSIPHIKGDSAILTTKIYNFTGYSQVQLCFNQICKVAPQDKVIIEYKKSGSTWTSLSAYTYLGKAVNYSSSGFNANSYADWKGNDNLAMPEQSWWKEETFDIGQEVSGEQGVQFRFIIKRGTTEATQISYGWLLDDVEIIAANYIISKPSIELVYPYFKDKVYNTGPWTINANVKTTSPSPIQITYLSYTAIENNTVIGSDSIPMTNVQGDLYQAVIPRFAFGTKIFYTINTWDVTGNTNKLSAEFVIISGNTYLTLEEGGTHTGTYPFNHVYGYSRSMVLYPAAQMSQKISGKIHSVGLHVATVGGGGFPMKIWLKTVPPEKIIWNQTADNIDWTELTKDATLCYDNLIHFSATGWFDIPLDTTFYYNGNDNLVVMFEQNCGRTSCADNGYMPSTAYSSYYFTMKSNETQVYWNKSSDNNPPTLSTTLTVNWFCPNLRIGVYEDMYPNSVAIHAININDTIVVSTTDSVPVIATIKNKGDSLLTSAVIYYSINGSTPKATNWSGSLSWDFSEQDTLDYYTPKKNGYDTITVWVKMPNGVTDSIIIDDTATKIVYNSDDILLSFVRTYAHIVYSAGPFDIIARIHSITGTSIDTVLLDVSAIQGGITTDTSYNMTFENNLWKTTIPQTVFGTKIIYSITLTDKVNNVITIIDSFLIQQPISLLDNSVAMDKIISPSIIATANVPTPIKIQIRNRGINTLTSCKIYYSINEGAPVLYNYTGSLPSDFTDTITLNYYIPVESQRDTISIWVEMPNGVIDLDLNDDRMRVITLGCSGNLSGTETVGMGGKFPSLTSALNTIRECGLSGNLTLQLKGISTENVDLTNMTDCMNGYHLTITSSDGHPDSAIIRPTLGVGITLGNSRNITLKAIGIDVSAYVAYAVRFTATCTNIVIRDCKILASPTSTATSTGCIYKTTSSGHVDSIFIQNNYLDGGYYGIYLVGGVQNQYGTNIVLDSNIAINNSYYGIYSYYNDCISFSHNTVMSRTANTSDTWYALRMYYSNANVLGNRVIQRSKAISYPYGLHLNYYNYNATDAGLIANNEINISTTERYYGIYHQNSKSRILHNSIYISGGGGAYGINIANSTAGSYEIKNNNIVMTSPLAIPIYLGTLALTYDVDNNNMYAPNYTGYAGGNKTTIAAWQQTVVTDMHSRSILPNFNANDLSLSDYMPFYTQQILTEISTDITGASRTGITSLGAYHGITAYNINGSLSALSGYREGMVSGLQDTIKVAFINLGATTLTVADIGWSYNNVQQPSVSWKGSLRTGQADTVILGVITYPSTDKYTLSAWIKNLDTLQDEHKADDSINLSATVCYGALSGTYTVGATGVFPSLSKAFEIIALCETGGDIVLEMETGVYHQSINLSNIDTLLGNHTLTITSVTHNADDVKFVTTGAGIILSNSNNIILRNITVDATQGIYAIQFAGACTNVVIRECKLLTDTTSITTTSVIYKASSTGILDSVFIIDNLLDGGYYGIYLYGGTGTGAGAMASHFVFDSNTVSNQYHYGTDFHYTAFSSCSYNTFLSRRTNKTIWYALRISNSNGTIIGNKILQRTNQITSPTGIYLSYFNNYNTQDTGLVANNEIMLYSTAGAGYPGIYCYSNVKAKLLHNSIYVNGTGAGVGIRIVHGTSNRIVVKNNNIVMESTGAFPIYLNASAGIAQYYDIDNNNMYSKNSLFFSYAGSSGVSKESWHQIVTTDQNSFSVAPAFLNNSIDLRLSNYSPFYTSPLPEVTHDITVMPRFGTVTSIGCYHGITAYNVNAALERLTGMREGILLGESDTIKVVLVNYGATTLTAANILWSYNNTQQPAVSWLGNLPLGASDTVTLGKISYTGGNYTLKAWINNLGSLQDNDLTNDTTRAFGYVCPTGMSGVYTIGSSQTYKTLSDAFDMLNFCGAGGDITFELESGTYNEKIDLIDLSTLLGNHKLIITSAMHDAKDVTFITNTVGITLSNSNNIMIKDITVDARAGNYPIQFTGACSNIVIRDCRLLADTVTTSSSKQVIYKASGTGIVDSIFVIKNLLDGGFNGFYFHGGTASQYGTHITFDSNTVINHYQHGIYPQYLNFTSCSYNTVSNRSANDLYSDWYAIRMDNSNGSLIGNRIIQRSINPTTALGIYLQNANINHSAEMGLIANNEFIFNAKEDAYGIYALSYSHTKILHNSIYIRGSASSVMGIYVVDANGAMYEIKNNSIVLENAAAYPIYVNGTNYLSQYDIDYNNMYAPQYVGRVGGSNITTITAWQQAISSDKHSTSILPSFIDNTQNLKLSNYTGLECKPILSVEKDIEDSYRYGCSTVMGAYDGFLSSTVNAELSEVINWKEGQVLGQTDVIKVVLHNKGLTTLTKVNIGWEAPNGTLSTIQWTGNLLHSEKDTVTLGNITYLPLTNTFRAWINDLGGVLTDDCLQNDTVSVTGQVCAFSLQGVYVIGTASGNDYVSLAEALTYASRCGVSGDVVFEFQPGTSYPAMDLSGISSIFGEHTLTITSTTHNANEVVITRSNNGAGITLAQSNNIIIKDITVDVKAQSANSYAIQFKGACSNVVIRDCRLLVHPMIFTPTVSVIHKADGTGSLDSIFIRKNVLDGGYYGLYLYGSSSAQDQGRNIIFDSNTVSNQAYFGINTDYIDLTSCSYNSILTRQNYTVSSWTAVSLSNGKTTVIGNRIIQRNSETITRPTGIRLYSCNQNNLRDTGLIVNNELILSSTNQGYGIYMERSRLKMLHNSVYVAGSSLVQGIYIRGISGEWSEVKNNNIFMESPDAYAIYFESNTNMQQYDLDYNNMYAENIGYVGSFIRTIADWQKIVTTDKHSVAVQPAYVDASVSLALSASDRLLFPSHPEVAVDINQKTRPVVSAAGAYVQPSVSFDAMLLEMTGWKTRFIKDQSISVSAALVNLCDVSNITTATFGWSINGQPQPTKTWNASPALQPYQKQNVSIDVFEAPNTDTVYVAVWIESLNGQTDVIKWNDTLYNFSVRDSLAAFVAPFVDDTIHDLSFTVNTLIRTQTGAPAASPQQMNLDIIVNDREHINTTVTMVQNGDIWEAHIPSQYYNSKVIYSTTISDVKGNTITLTDSTYIHYSYQSVDLYSKPNLSIMELTNPINLNVGGKSCSDEYVPLKIALANTGQNDYDFSVNTVTINVEVSNAISYTVSRTLDSGIFLSGAMDTIVVDPSFPVYMPGQYDIKVWLTSSIDSIMYDDTIESVYISERIGLPIDENFSANFPSEFVATAVNSSAVWTIISQGSGSDTAVRPVYGTGMLAFTGDRGEMTHLSTRQLELRGTVLPAMEFWYFHDTIESEDYMDVRITTDGGETYTQLLSLLKQHSVYGWAHYTADLTPYQNGQCINILFEAMRISPGTGTQYIDSINISSFPDLAVAELLLPEIGVCDREEKDLGIVLSAIVNRAIDLSIYNTALIVEMPGRSDIIPLNKKIDRNSSDTIWLSHIDFPTGDNIIRSYLSAAVDIFSDNDTLVETVSINPKISVSIQRESTPSNCLTGDFVVYPTITIYNDGNMDVSDIGLIFQIDTGETGTSPYILFEETCTAMIPASSSHVYTFTHAYSVPWKADYYSRVTAWLKCDSALIDTISETPECVDTKDLYIVSIDNPLSASRDEVGTSVQVSVTLRNRSDYYPFNNVNITVRVTNSQGIETVKFMETIATIGTLSTVNHHFTTSYTVPNDTVYYLSVYVESYENYPKNDTASSRRETENVSISSTEAANDFTVDQNVPNPAVSATRIDYSIPEAGTIIFRVHSISAQLLYSKIVEASRGTNSIKLNTEAFSAGVYFYSIEYKGQKRVKQLIINNE